MFTKNSLLIINTLSMAILATATYAEAPVTPEKKMTLAQRWEERVKAQKEEETKKIEAQKTETKEELKTVKQRELVMGGGTDEAESPAPTPKHEPKTRWVRNKDSGRLERMVMNDKGEWVKQDAAKRLMEATTPHPRKNLREHHAVETIRPAYPGRAAQRAEEEVKPHSTEAGNTANKESKIETHDARLHLQRVEEPKIETHDARLHLQKVDEPKAPSPKSDAQKRMEERLAQRRAGEVPSEFSEKELEAAARRGEERRAGMRYDLNKAKGG